MRDLVREPLRGWRAWQVVATRNGPALSSWWVNALWPARRPFEARCAIHGPRPVAHHACGIHAFAAREAAVAYLDSDHEAPSLFVHRALGLVVGRISGWGRAVAHTRGWRSQFAYPYELFLVRGDRSLARTLADRYAVETSPFPP